MVAWRIGSGAYPLLDGAGAANSDTARWNSRGRVVIYAAEHYATALLEKAAQLNSVRLPQHLVYIRIELPREMTAEEVTADALPGWDSEDRATSQSYGDAWYDSQRSLVLIVPSLAAPGLERNVLINQRHPAFGRVTGSTPEPLRCHPRLLARGAGSGVARSGLVLVGDRERVGRAPFGALEVDRSHGAGTNTSSDRVTTDAPDPTVDTADHSRLTVTTAL